MTRSAALRASTIFLLLAVSFGVIGTTTYSPLAEAIFLIAGSLCAVMLLFAAATPAHAPVLVRVRTSRR